MAKLRRNNSGGGGSGSSCGKNNNNNRRGSGGPAPFLMKTHGMVEDATTNEVISWGETGATFVVWKPAEFARDLLPVHFKHNNFSSFVRQLNTYGFHKAVPDRWEFANDNFRRGERGLLSGIRRRKAPPNPSSSTPKPTNKNSPTTTPTLTSTSTSSSSTSSSPPSSPQTPPPQNIVDLSNENEKLKKRNEILNKELTQAKQQCEQLLGFLSKYVNTDDLNANLLMKEGQHAGVEIIEHKEERQKAKEEEKGKSVACLKLFGVLLKGFEGEKKDNGRKRRRCEEEWMAMGSQVRGSSKVCN